MKELAKKYDFNIVEKDKYQYWLETGIFTQKNVDNKPIFSMILPPPNITGNLHLGHAWNNTLQDAVARYKRLQGFYVNWFPGMDHAGIATQTKVEADIWNKEKKRQRDFTREAFISKIAFWKTQYSNIIRQQWRVLGLSLNYDAEKFTLDDDVNELVQETFIKLYNDKLIYRGKKIINWDPYLQTALSNMEVDYKETKGKMYYIKYPLVGSDNTLVIATTRPETMFGDQAIIFNPQDIRYQKYANLQVINPATKQVIPILADEHVDMNFGTGLMKCTPGHDFNDYEIGQRHNLALRICMNPDGTMNELAGKYQGLDRFICRKVFIKDLEKEKLIVKIDDYVHQVGYSQRSNVIVEPYLSEQWFVKMEPLVQKVIELQKSSEAVKFFPHRFSKVLEQWLENIQDWCISRQLWWGHRLPVWYHKTTNEIIVGKVPPNSSEWIQDEDVLDTWFSSGLWPLVFSKWNRLDFCEEYLTSSLLVTGYDIIFFWISRMMFQTLYLADKKPFNQVLIHGLVRDISGKKMSKSLGNGIDPLDVIADYGVDSLRYFLLTNSSPGQDLKFNDVKIKAAWNFINKLWNASRYVLLNLPPEFIPAFDITELPLTAIDYWILEQLNKTLKKITNYINNYEFALLGHELWTFTWNQFCSWYIELSKINLENEKYRFVTTQVLFYVLKQILILLHPFIPFVSEDIYQNLVNNSQSIMLEKYPQILENLQDGAYLNNIISIVLAIRELRAEKNIKKSVSLKLNLKSDNLVYLQNHQEINVFLAKLINSEIITINAKVVANENIISLPILDGVIDVQLKDVVVNNEENIKMINNKLAEFAKEIARSEKLLNNEHFLTKAPFEKIALEKQRYQRIKKMYVELQKQLQELQK